MKNTIKFLFLIVVNSAFSQAITDTGTKVGVNKTNPFYTLDVNGTGQYSGLLNLLSGAYINANKTIKFDAFNEEYYIGGQGNNDYTLQIGYGNVVGVNPIMVFNSSKNVGIGTTNPDGKLDLFGNNSNSTNLILSANYENIYRWRFNTIDRGNAIDMDITASDGNDSQEAVLKLSRSSSGRPEFQLYDNSIVANNGYVGIGTATPLVKLDIEGGDLYVGEEASVNGNRREIRIYGFDNGGKHYGSLHSNYDENKRTFDINTNNYVQQIKIDASANSTANILLNPGISGSVGIGTINPNATLQVGDSNNTGTPQQEVEKKRLSLAPVCHSGSDWFFTTRDNNYANLDIGYSNNKTITLRHDGNVGIGATSPDSKLTVAGKIHSQEVKVTINAGADFVFENDYKLPSLEFIENYIKKNKHLPEIESEKEMQNNGILLAEMSIKLLQKIEELTLYTIEQQKEIETLKKENSKIQLLSKRLTEIEKLLNAK